MKVDICPVHGPTSAQDSPDGTRFCCVADKREDICGKTTEVIEVVRRDHADLLADALDGVATCCEGEGGIPGLTAWSCREHESARSVLAKYREATS